MTKNIVLSAEKHTYGLIKCLSHHASASPSTDLTDFISFIHNKLDINQKIIFQDKIKSSLALNKYYKIFTGGDKPKKEFKTNKF